jgi:hypothetical protein
MKEPNSKINESFKRGLFQGAGIVIGMFATSIFAVAVSGTVTWTSGQTLTAADLNATINGLVTAVNSIPDWTKNGTNAVYTAGNVGIGTTTPTDKLEVTMNSGANQDGATIRAVNTSGVGSQPGIRFNMPDGTKIFSIAGDVFNDSLFIVSRTTGGGIPDIAVNQAGNVGIRNANPTKKLDVSGEIRASSFLMMADQGTATYATKIFLSTSGCGAPASYQQIGFISGIGYLCWGEVVNYP